ncbi:Membrane proteinase PrsW, cleaves anti-sigma factor RsiW, M82 family [Selenomonas sp. WCT3]|uniref:PrsW family glutamic-type intramembrane protease n=1 Tax=Selenomonas sp. WCT3 TaxID=3158785 RepID=UPI00088D81B2|nr:Membrane proteinase PrsW, cleaves anti-sigma factor RsiW, M82 family [Selenomonas ruminantium]
MFCVNCGTQLAGDERFCTKCGQPVVAPPPMGMQGMAAGFRGQPMYQRPYYGRRLPPQKGTLDSLIDNVNRMTGGTEHVELKMKDLVENVFRKHTKQEAEQIFIYGTAATTPPEEQISTDWPHPWLYSRVFLVLAVTMLGLLFMNQMLGNKLAAPGVIFIGALAVPFSALIFFFEVNAPRNISIFETTQVFFIGGVMSLIMTMFVYGFIGFDKLNNTSTFLVGLAEEVGKVMVIAYFLRGQEKKYILNGLLIGAAVGAGFAVFETAGYIAKSNSLTVLYLRGALALGGHVAWAGLTGAALAMVKGDKPLRIDHLMDMRFLKFLAVSIVLHGLWDMPLLSHIMPLITQVGLMAVVWIFLLVMLHAGLRQISTIQQQAKAAGGAQTLP